MPARFSQQHQRVRPNSNEDKVVARAKEHFEKLSLKFLEILQEVLQL